MQMSGGQKISRWQMFTLADTHLLIAWHVISGGRLCCIAAVLSECRLQGLLVNVIAEDCFSALPLTTSIQSITHSASGLRLVRWKAAWHIGLIFSSLSLSEQSAIYGFWIWLYHRKLMSSIRQCIVQLWYESVSASRLSDSISAKQQCWTPPQNIFSLGFSVVALGQERTCRFNAHSHVLVLSFPQQIQV